MKVGDKVVVISRRFRHQQGGVGHITDIIEGDQFQPDDLTHTVQLSRASHPNIERRDRLIYGPIDLQVIEQAVDNF